MKKISIDQKDYKHQIDIPKFLEILEPVEYPTTQEIESERSKYISFISQIEPTPVSLPLVKRIKQMIRQMERLKFWGFNNIRKERFVMSSALMRILIISGIIFSLTTGAFAFTLTSLPDSPFYDAKLAMENVSLSLMDDPAKITIKHLELAQNRIQEMIQQSKQGDIPDGATLERLQQHLVYALHFAAQVQGDEMQSILNQAQNMAQNQVQTLAQVKVQTSGNAEGTIGSAAQIMNQFMFQLAFGLGNPVEFRYQYQGKPDTANLEFKAIDCDCTPIGDENKYGQTDPSGEVNGKGGSQDCQECIPAGDENKYGPQPDQPGPGEPGGNPDCTNCDPDGDQNKNGPQPPGNGGPGGKQN